MSNNIFDIEAMQARLDAHDAWVKALIEKLEAELDYGHIPGIAKPTLFKPGAEKVLIALDATALIVSLELTHAPDGSSIYDCKVAGINLTTGQTMAHGEGSAKLDAGILGKKADFGLNRAVKMAFKRAQVALAITMGGLSGYFTQDMEDAPPEEKSNGHKPAIPKPAPPAPMEGPALAAGDTEDNPFPPDDVDPFAGMAGREGDAPPVSRKDLEDEVWAWAHSFDGSAFRGKAKTPFGEQCIAMFDWLQERGLPERTKMQDWNLAQLQLAVRLLDTSGITKKPKEAR